MKGYTLTYKPLLDEAVLLDIEKPFSPEGTVLDIAKDAAAVAGIYGRSTLDSRGGAVMSDSKLRGRDLAEAVIEHVLLFPEQHDQNDIISTTECGTTGCIVGWALALHTGISNIDAIKGLPEARPYIRQDDISWDDEDGHKDWDVSWIADLLGVDREELESKVYYVEDKNEAIANFKELMNGVGE